MSKEFNRIFDYAPANDDGGNNKEKVKLRPPTPEEIDEIIRLRSGGTHQYLPMAHDRNWRRYPDSKKQETVVIYSGADMPGKRLVIPWIEDEV